MAYFIKSSEEGKGNAPVNLDKIVYVTKDYMYKASSRSYCHKIIFVIAKDWTITWNYDLEITRDSDYLCIINNQNLEKREE